MENITGKTDATVETQQNATPKLAWQTPELKTISMGETELDTGAFDDGQGAQADPMS